MQTQTSSFVPLTNLPGVKDAADASTLPNFFNSLYKLCIGAAAVIAVLQIMRAGVYFMFNKGSVSTNEKGKSLVQNAVLGLVLVLSPAIVFGIINPKILNLNINLQDLRPVESGASPTTLSAENQTALTACNVTVTPDQQKCFDDKQLNTRGDYNTCLQGNARATCDAVFKQQTAANTASCIPAATTQGSCVSDKLGTVINITTGNQTERCDDYTAIHSARMDTANPASSCDAGIGEALVPPKCCVATQDLVCCGKSRLAQTLDSSGHLVSPTLYHYVVYYPGKRNGKACRTTSEDYRPTKPECDTELTTAQGMGPGTASGVSYSKPQVLQACIATKDRTTYKLPANIANLPAC